MRAPPIEPMTENEVWQAAGEGWMMDYTREKGWHIASCKNINSIKHAVRLCSDAEAEAHVFKRADEGSAMHKRVITAIIRGKILHD